MSWNIHETEKPQRLKELWVKNNPDRVIFSSAAG